MENNNVIEEGFVAFYKQLKKLKLTNKELVKKEIIDTNLEEFKVLYDVLTSIDWDNDDNIDEAYEMASFAIYNINYVLITQMVMLEKCEEYENAKILYDLIYQTYYLIGEQLSPTFDSTLEKPIIKENIKEAVTHVKIGIQIIEENL
jgi:hypothetical protein